MDEVGVRIVLWNCNNGISKSQQIEYFQSFNADLAIVPELREKDISALAPTSHVWITNNFENKAPKGLGILGFGEVTFAELPRDEEMEIYIPLRVLSKGFAFNLLAFWNFYSACKQGRFKGVDGPDCLEFSALKHYGDLFSDPVLVAGDLNFGPTFMQDSFLEFANVLEGHDLRSLYHRYHSLPVAESKHSTFRSNRQRMHHIDHFFGSKTFYENMTSFRVEEFKNVVLSDHAPLILDLKVNQAVRVA